MKHLVGAGTTITASPDQAKRLRVADAELERLLTVSETERSSIDEKDVNLDDVKIADAEIKPRKRKSTKVIAEDLEAESEADDLDEDVQLLGKFVELCDLFPPLPQKGTFDVETIKGSQYFFS